MSVSVYVSHMDGCVANVILDFGVQWFMEDLDLALTTNLLHVCLV